MTQPPVRFHAFNMPLLKRLFNASNTGVSLISEKGAKATPVG